MGVQQLCNSRCHTDVDDISKGFLICLQTFLCTVYVRIVAVHIFYSGLM